MNNKYLFPLLLVFLLILSACNNGRNISVVDFESLSESGNWKVIKQDSTEYTGQIKLKAEKMLMHFLHWWPLNENNNEISTEHTKDLLLNLWGMQFDLTGVEGETKINGHQAFFVEGNLRNVVKTRFIVWNCPQSNRQFLSDCNINISLSTPQHLLNLQVNDITNSVCCHKTEDPVQNPKLPQHINYEDQNITLDLPESWRSSLFFVSTDSNEKGPGYYANGVTEKEGAIWSLVTDTQKEINLTWKKSSAQISEDNFQKALSNVFNDTIIIMQDTLKYRFYCADTNSQNIKVNERYIENSGSFDLITDIESYAPIDTSHYQYKAFIWKNNETEYFLFASMVAYNNMWGIPFDLAPTELQFNNFVRDEVLKNITNHPITFK